MKLIKKSDQKQILIDEVNNDFIRYTLHCSSCILMPTICPTGEVKIIKLLTSIDREIEMPQNTIKDNQKIAALNKMLSLPEFIGYEIVDDDDQCWFDDNFLKRVFIPKKYIASSYVSKKSLFTVLETWKNYIQILTKEYVCYYTNTITEQEEAILSNYDNCQIENKI
jgi:hypothetical protein